jgi:hypothetical protein
MKRAASLRGAALFTETADQQKEISMAATVEYVVLKNLRHDGKGFRPSADPAKPTLVKLTAKDAAPLLKTGVVKEVPAPPK